MKGMSLLELLITLGILSVLLAISIPDFKNLVESVSADATLKKLATAIQLGKSAAITNRTTVTLCRSVDGFACGGSWQDGVLVFTDSNRDRVINDEDRLIRYITFPDSKGHIRFRVFQNKQYLQLTSLGITHSQNGNFTYCPFSGDSKIARQLIVNRTARLRFAQDSDGDGIKEDSRGRPLSCD
ncbi:MAG: GspH/FimT family pseudopilin [Proteobacteria bacterium]|jgi:type IV fimbrial biogenesis protein FimT|nr:GspH/FimT family pseudopilin [Pseudomonadota bacterium]MDA1290595.1 GspH/FimT family pseudopilin [Pseudomonadota bacterium]